MFIETVRRLRDDQEEYIDRRGIHVVVGHYVGDVGSVGQTPNLTEGRNIFTHGNHFSKLFEAMANKSFSKNSLKI